MSGTSEQLKKKNSIRVVWSSTIENILIDLWQEKIEELRGTRKNSHIYQEIAAKLREAGFYGSWGDVRTKVDNLTRKYRQEKNKIGPSGGAPSTWEHYHKINNILGGFRLQNISSTMYESTDMSSLLDETENIIVVDPTDFDIEEPCSSGSITSEDMISQQPQPKKRKLDVNAELVRLAKQRNDMQRQVNEERKLQMTEILKRLENISNQNAAFQSQLLAILREKK